MPTKPAFTIESLSSPLFGQADCRFIVRWGKGSSSQSLAVTLKAAAPDQRTYLLKAGDIEIALDGCHADFWRRFAQKYLSDLLDFAVSQALYPTPEDMVLLAPSDSDKVWAITVLQSDARRWYARLVESSRPESLDISYAIMGISEEERATHLTSLLGKLQRWITITHLSSRQGPSPRWLTIKVYPTELWFLRFPIDEYRRSGKAGFGDYRGVEWVVSDRGFTENNLIRQQLEAELADPARLISRSVVVVNTYAEHSHWTLYQEGVALITTLLDCFDGVETPTGPVSLRWARNPSLEELTTLLLDPNTCYFFADFESRSGMWQLGQDIGAKRLPCESFFTPESLGFDLSHIRLMRVFHCNSVFNPAAAFIDHREPADEQSIVRKLLNLGAQRVEGGLTEESFFDYLCSLFDLFCRPGHLGFILRMKCIELGTDFTDLMARVNQFLTICGWPAICENNLKTKMPL